MRKIPSVCVSFGQAIRSFEKEIIFEALSRTNGNKSAAARILNITERHLRSRIEILDIKDDVNKKRET